MKISFQKVTKNLSQNQIGFVDGKLMIATGESIKSFKIPELTDKVVQINLENAEETSIQAIGVSAFENEVAVLK